jgi:DNA-binding HxlR family transcriptional regulator
VLRSIVRDLISGPRRFTEIERSLRRANPKMITTRLRELEKRGLLSRTAYAVVPPRVEDALTERGLRPVIDALSDRGLPLTAERRD